MILRILTYLFFYLISISLVAQDDYQSFFTNGTVRYDFEFIGNSAGEEVVHQQTKYLADWGGIPATLITDNGLGACQYQVFDRESGNLIFQKGFSPLFMEWQSTTEAKLRKRSFYYALFFPRPKSDVNIIIQKRTANNQWTNIFIDSLIVDDYFIHQERGELYDIDTLIYNGSAEKKIDLVFLSEGYQQAELDKFVADTRLLTNYLFSVVPFCRQREAFNIYAVKVPSFDSGTTVPGEHVYKNTAFKSHYYTFDTPRYLTTSDMKAVYDAIDGLAWDHIYLLVNEKRYGGGGMYNSISICTADNERSPFVFCHEFGHGFAGLGDEYYGADVAYSEEQKNKVEPWEPNLTTLVDFSSKWQAMVEKDIPVPTPRDSVFKDKVGVFEGGGYFEKGIYSPVMSCWMKEYTANGFCPVCQKAISDAILFHTK